MRTILALDVATVTGWAYGTVGRPVSSGSLRFGPATPTCDEDVFYAAMVWLNDQLGTLRPNVVAIEAPIQSAAAGGRSNPKTMGRLIGLQAVLRTVVRARLPSVARLVNVQSARKSFIGSGNLPGEEAKRRVRARCLELGWVDAAAASFDRCDALCVFAKASLDLDPDCLARAGQLKLSA